MELEIIIKVLAEASRLTPREIQVLTGIAEGKNLKQIALSLGRSPKTVESHKSNLMRKLEIYSVAELTKYAIKVGLTNL